MDRIWGSCRQPTNDISLPTQGLSADHPAPLFPVLGALPSRASAVCNVHHHSRHPGLNKEPSHYLATLCCFSWTFYHTLGRATIATAWPLQVIRYQLVPCQAPARPPQHFLPALCVKVQLDRTALNQYGRSLGRHCQVYSA